MINLSLRALALTAFANVFCVGASADTTVSTMDTVKIDNLWYSLNTTDKTAEVIKPQAENGTTTYYTEAIIPSTVTNENVVYTVTSIGEKAFFGSRTVLTGNVSIPKTITKIGKQAFFNCNKIAAVYIEDIKAYCEIDFSYTTSSNPYSSPFAASSSTQEPICSLYVDNVAVEDLVIPDGTTKIGEYAFIKCLSITSVTIPSSVTSIGQGAFQSTNLTSVTLSEGLETIGASAFNNCKSLTEISIPNTVTTIEGSAFALTSLTSVVIPSSVKSLSGFNKCESLTSVTLSEGLETIANSAFAGCTALTSITIPSTVTTMEQKAFSSCTGLTSVTFLGTTAPTMETNNSGSNYPFTGCTGVTTVAVPVGSEANYSEVKIGGNTIGSSSFTVETFETVSTTAVRWATGCVGYDAIVPEGTKAFYISAVKDNKITIKTFPEVDGSMVIPAKQGFIYTADQGLYAFKKCTSTTTVAVNDNLLTGVYGDTATVAASSVYVLSKLANSENVGFQRFTGTKIAPNHAYLDGSKVSSGGSSGAKSLTFEYGATTEIAPTAVEEQPVDDKIYNLQGQRVATMQPGHIYIKGGKKILFR